MPMTGLSVSMLVGNWKLLLNGMFSMNDFLSRVYECNKWCKCDKRMCENRVVQQGLTVRLQLFKTHRKGWGVRCMDDVDKGTFVCCYTGMTI